MYKDVQLKKSILSQEQIKAAIVVQNERILELYSESETRLEDYNKLLAKPERVRFKTKYVELKSNECEDVKTILDDIRSSGF